MGLSGNSIAEVIPTTSFSFLFVSLFWFGFVVCLLVLGVKEIVVKKFNYTRRVPIKHIIIGAVSKSTAKLGIR